MFRKLLILLPLVGACKMKDKTQPLGETQFEALRISETGGFTGGFEPYELGAKGLVYHPQQEVMDTLNADAVNILHREAGRLATIPGYQGHAGNVQREIWLMRNTDTLYYRWPIEDTTKTAKTLNVSFGRLYRLVP